MQTISRHSYDYRDQYQEDDEFMVVQEQDEQLELENDFHEIDFPSYQPQQPPVPTVPRVSRKDEETGF